MLECRDLHKHYPDAHPLAGVSLRLAPGETMVVSGPSGSGKTTLLRVLAGLEVAEHGTVHISGQLASDPTPRLPPHRRGIALVFQRPALWPHLSVLQNLLFAAGGRHHRARALALLEEMALGQLASRWPHSLSAGQAGRVALARALVTEPRHLLLDEPLANLDPQTRGAMLELVQRHTARLNSGVLWVTHDEAEAQALGGQRAWLVEGRLWADPAASMPWPLAEAAP